MVLMLQLVQNLLTKLVVLPIKLLKSTLRLICLLQKIQFLIQLILTLNINLSNLDSNAAPVIPTRVNTFNLNKTV
jgi:hypothetical protein